MEGVRELVWRRVAVFLIVALFWSGSALARIITVPSLGYTNIQQAINNAADGDTVLLQTGTFTGLGNSNIDFQGKAITLKSRRGADYSVIDLQGAVGFLFANGESRSSILSGVTIKNGSIGIICNSSSPTINGCVIQNNVSSTGSGIICSSGSPLISSCRITGNRSVHLAGGIYCFEAKPEITYCQISQNVSKYDAGGIGCWGGESALIENCTFTANQGGEAGGLFVNGVPASIKNCIMKGNISTYSAGGLSCWSSSSTIVNCLVVQNSAPFYGGGMFFLGSSPIVTNCTVADNSSGYPGSGIANFYGASPLVTNCIVTGTKAVLINDPAEDHPVITYSDVEEGFAGQGNVNVDPLFVNRSAGNYFLRAGSLCINSGTNSAPQRPLTDINGNPRIINATVDLGTFEFGSVPGDLNGDLTVNTTDRNIIYSAMLKCAGQPGYVAAADYDRDGCITNSDYLQWYKYYTAYTSGTAQNSR